MCLANGDEYENVTINDAPNDIGKLLKLPYITVMVDKKSVIIVPEYIISLEIEEQRVLPLDMMKLGSITSR